MEDNVVRPKHYGGEANPHEPIKVIEHYGLGFCLGNAIKYILRADKKGSLIDDLKKARWYLDREIQGLEKDTTVIQVDRAPTDKSKCEVWLGGPRYCKMPSGHAGTCKS
jgi:hypothetical protein